MYDTIVRNGFVIDGTGAPGQFADVAISGGRVAGIGKYQDDEATEIIDAKGKIVAPGHVTQHSHYDAQLFWDPYCSDSGANGVTTVVNANCGFGYAPVRPEHRDRTMAMMETTEQIALEQQRIGLPWNWETFPEYFEKVDALAKGVNVLTYLPCNPLLIYVMGLEDAKSRRPTPAEMDEMHRLINEGMDAGAIGISMAVIGLDGNTHVDFDGTAMPTDMLHPDDMVALGRAVADRGEGLIQVSSQIFEYGDWRASELMAEMAKGSGARVIHNTFHTSDGHPEIVDRELGWIERMRGLGLDVVASSMINRGWVEIDFRNIDTAAGMLSAVRRLVGCNTDEAKLALLEDAEFLAQFEADYEGAMGHSDALRFEPQIIAGVGGVAELAPLVGRRLGEVAEEQGKSVVAMLLELGRQTGLELQLKSGFFSANDPEQAVRHVRKTGVALGVSDGGAHTKAFGNGHYATELLIWLVREQKMVSLEEMHSELSLVPARAVMLFDRGAILPGYWADLLIYDLDKLYLDFDSFDVIHDMPGKDWRRQARAGGYERIMVNGVTTFLEGQNTGATPGVLARVTRTRQQAGHRDKVDA